jgi:hypothetical protein
MGLGWMVLPERGLATHDGGTGGFSSSLWLNLRERRGALALANAQVGVADIASHLLDAKAPLRDLAAERRKREELAAQATLALSAAQAQVLVGVYALSPQFKITVRKRGTQLFAQATGQGEIEVFARGPRRLFAKVAPLELDFEGQEGQAPAFVLHQDGRQNRFLREGDERDESIALGAEQLVPLVGVYALNPGFKLSVRAEGGRLLGRATGQGEFELFARSPRRFFARVAPLEISFEGESGPAPALVLEQAGREARFVRE